MRNDLSIDKVIDEFRAAMAGHGIVTHDEIRATGKLERFHVDGDAKGSTNGWFILHYDERPAGQFGCNKRFGLDHKISWSSKTQTTFSPEQKREWAKRMEQQRAEKAAAEAQRQADAAAVANRLWNDAEPTEYHPYLERKGVKSHGLRIGNWEFADNDTGEIRIFRTDALLVPLTDRTRNIHSLQAIFPVKCLSNGTRDKDYLAGGAKLSMFHVIGKPVDHDGRRVFVICEGYATAASVHETTGHCALVVFDTANILPVSQSIRERQPDAIIVFAADNDLGITKPVNNPGIHFATAAAKLVDGLVAVPPFELIDGDYNEEGKWEGPTDFNDLHQLRGAGAVVQVFDALLNPQQPEPDNTPPHDPEQPPEEPAGPVDNGPHDDDELVANAGFTILGYDEGDYFVFHHAKQQIMTLRKGDIGNDIGLIELAGTWFWETYFNNGKGGMDKKAIASWIFNTAHSRGIYDPTRIRGRGAWLDKGRNVFHHGSHLTVDGEQVMITRMRSGYVYPLGRALPSVTNALTDDEGKHLVEVAGMVRWSMPASAALMSGWAMLAPICGALSWRPHIWLLGAAGSGKSTVQTKYLGALLRDIGVYAQGDSTEPGLRQHLKADALPVLIDEIESNNDQDKKRTESIVGMVRKTSSESWAKTYKGTVSGDSMNFQIRSMFCLASINANMPTKADIDRLTRLNIRQPDRNETVAKAHWEKLEIELNKIDQDDTISSRMLSRALGMLPVIQENIARFRRVCASHFGSQRDGDQFGTLLAGCWSLMHSERACDYDVLQMLAQYDFHEHTEDHDQDDATKALEAILGSKIRIAGGAEWSVYEVIRECVSGYAIGVITEEQARSILIRHGIRVEGDELWFGINVTNLKDLVANKPFVTDLRGQLLRIKGAKRVQNPVRFMGSLTRCVSVPLMPLLNDPDDKTEQMPF